MENEIDVLIVEDSANDAELTLRALRGSVGTDRLRHVEDGVKALDVLFGADGLASRAGATLPRMILLDLKLPRLDGHEVLRRVKSDERTRGIPVIVFTSSKEERDVNESYRLGANSYLVKPLGFEEYTTIVADAARYWMLHNQPPLGKTGC
jgi:CheY-like chemotaxis protein